MNVLILSCPKRIGTHGKFHFEAKDVYLSETVVRSG